MFHSAKRCSGSEPAERDHAGEKGGPRRTAFTERDYLTSITLTCLWAVGVTRLVRGAVADDAPLVALPVMIVIETGLWWAGVTYRRFALYAIPLFMGSGVVSRALSAAMEGNREPMLGLTPLVVATIAVCTVLFRKRRAFT